MEWKKMLKNIGELIIFCFSKTVFFYRLRPLFESLMAALAAYILRRYKDTATPAKFRVFCIMPTFSR